MLFCLCPAWPLGAPWSSEHLLTCVCDACVAWIAVNTRYFPHTYSVHASTGVGEPV